MDTASLLLEVLAALLTASGMAYGLISLWSARDFERTIKNIPMTPFGPGEAPGVSILKPVKGIDARMYAGLVSHCLLQYSGDVELCLA